MSLMLWRGEELFWGYTAAVLHEAVHFLAAFLLGIKAEGIEADIFGIRLKLPYILSCSDRIIISAAGPLASFVIFLFLAIADRIFSFTGDGLAFFAFANFCIGVINILPVSPLDGGGILKAVLERILGIILGGRIFRIASVFVCVLYVAVAVFLFAAGIFNPALILVGIFLLLGIRHESYVSLNERKLVLSGLKKGCGRLKYIAYDGDTPVILPFSRINADYTLHTAVFCDGRFIGELTQAELCLAVQKHGAYKELKDCIEK